MIVAFVKIVTRWSKDNYIQIFPQSVLFKQLWNFLHLDTEELCLLNINNKLTDKKIWIFHVYHANQLFLLISRLDLFSPLSLIAD